jgi:hypothetical protein
MKTTHIQSCFGSAFFGKSLAALALGGFAILGSLSTSCATDASSDEFETVDDGGGADGWSTSPFAVQKKSFKIAIRINQDTVPLTGEALTTLKWDGLDRLTALPHPGPLRFEVPERDGEYCDETCRNAVIARAAEQGGKLTAVVRITRAVADVRLTNGTCARTLNERVEIDFSAATHGIHPDLEATYGFLKFQPVDDGPGLTLKTIRCV